MKTVTSKQFTITVLMIMLAQKLFLFAALLVKTGGRSSYISLLLMHLVEFALLIMIITILKIVPNRTFFNLLEKGATKIGGRIIAFLMLFCQAIKISLHVSGIRVFININLAQSINNWVAIIPVLIFLYIAASKTLRTIGRMSEIFAPFVLFAVFILFIMVISNVETSWLLPILEDGAKPVLKNMVVFPMWYGDMSYFLIFLGKVKMKSKRIYLPTLVAAAISSLLVQFFATVLIISYADIPHLLNYGNNVTNMLLYSSYSYSHGRFDVIIFSIWIFSLYIQIALTFFFFTRNLKYALNFKGNTIPSIVGVVTVFILVILVFHNEHNFYLFCTNLVVRISSIFNHFVVPIFVFIIALVLHFRHKKQTAIPIMRPSYTAKVKQRKVRANGT